MIKVTYIILCLLSGAFVLPLLVFIQLKYKNSIISKYIAFFSNFYLFVIIYGIYRIYYGSGLVFNLFAFIIFFLSYVGINITMPLFVNSLYRIPNLKVITNISVGITIILILLIAEFQQFYRIRIHDIVLALSFLYSICISIINLKKLTSNIEKTIGMAVLVFISFFLLTYIGDMFGFLYGLGSFLSFLVMNVISVVYLCYFIKFTNNRLDVVVDIVKSFDLTSREHEVFLLLKKGLTYKEISKDLAISVATVKSHLNKVYKKTNTKSRFELTAKY